jgi:uncharacterized protein YbjT (DUF2867 family)
MSIFLIIGATGNVGSRLAAHLAARGHTVRAATRSADDYDGPGTAVAFDYDDRATWGPALDGADGVFALAKSADREPQHYLVPFIDRAHEVGVERFVLMTAAGVEYTEAGFRRVERHLEASDLGWTILRPSWFMQNFYPGFLYPMIRNGGTIYLPAGDGASAFIDAEDIAAVAAEALTDDAHRGQAYTLTGPKALTYGEAVGALSTVAGREVRYQPIPDEAFRQSLADAGWLPGQIETMSVLFGTVRDGAAAHTSDAVERVTGRPPRSLQTFAREHADAFTQPEPS